MASAPSDINTLVDAIDKIYAQRVKTLSFQFLYTCGYHLVQRKQAAELYLAVKKAFAMHVNQMRGQLLDLARHESDRVVEQVLDCWDRHRVSIQLTRDVLLYLDKNYSPPDKLGVLAMGKCVWADHVLRVEPVLSLIQRTALNTLLQMRLGAACLLPAASSPPICLAISDPPGPCTGQPAHTMQLKALCVMLADVGREMGKDGRWKTLPSEVYDEHFEQAILRDTEAYYKEEGDKYFPSTAAPDYLRHVQQRLDEEKSRAEQCLVDTSVAKVAETIERTMIGRYKIELLRKDGSGLHHQLECSRIDNARLFYLAMRQIGALEPLLCVLKDYIVCAGQAIVKSQPGPGTGVTPISIIEDLIQFRKRLDKTISEAFSLPPSAPPSDMYSAHNALQDSVAGSDPAVSSVYDQAFDTVVNSNPRLASYMSMFLDQKLRASGSSVDNDLFGYMDKWNTAPAGNS
eukprot:gene9045-1623_t